MALNGLNVSLKANFPADLHISMLNFTYLVRMVSLITGIKQKTKEIFTMAAMLLFYILQICCLNNICTVLPRPSTIHHLWTLRWSCSSHLTQPNISHAFINNCSKLKSISKLYHMIILTWGAVKICWLATIMVISWTVGINKSNFSYAVSWQDNNYIMIRFK
jgi:hypothetical protein